jgi:hypothetical protein
MVVNEATTLCPPRLDIKCLLKYAIIMQIRELLVIEAKILPRVKSTHTVCYEINFFNLELVLYS